MTHEDALIAEAILGDEAKRFMESDVVKYILGVADQELKEALLELETADPDDKKLIQQLQNRAWRARSFPEWLNELVSKGDNALRVYQQQKQEG